MALGATCIDGETGNVDLVAALGGPVNIPSTPDAQDVADALIALGLATQS